MSQPKRCEISELILAIMSVFTFLILTVCPGGFLWFLLPSPVGAILALCCGALGPLLMYQVDQLCYGPRKRS